VEYIATVFRVKSEKIKSLLGLPFDPEDRGEMFLQSLCIMTDSQTDE
jgi:hypothetical protein